MLNQHKRCPAHVLAAVVVAVSATLLLAGCGGGGGSTPDEVVLVTHDSFAVSKGVKAAFEQESGLKLRILQGGDANEMLNRALLTAGDPQGDVIFGIDDSILSRALDAFVGDAVLHVVRGERTLAGAPGEFLSLFALGGPATGVTTEGLEYPLTGETLEPGTTRGVSNVFTRTDARVVLDSGVLLVVRPEGARR